MPKDDTMDHGHSQKTRKSSSQKRSVSTGDIDTHKPRFESASTSASADRVPAAIAGLFGQSNESIEGSSESLSTSTVSGSSTSLSTISGVTFVATPNLVHNKSIVPLEEFPDKTQCNNCGQPVVPEYTSTPSCLSALLLIFCCPCVFANCANLQLKYEMLKKPVFICPECQTIMSSDVPADFDPYDHLSQHGHHHHRRHSRSRHRNRRERRNTISELSIDSRDSRGS